MITKEKLREVISEWIKPMCRECEGIGGFWIHSSTTGVFSWTLYIDSSSRDRTISARLCYDQNNHHTGYIIYLNLDDDHPIIKITGDYLIDCISDDNSHNFNKEWLYDLLNRIRQAMGQNILESKIHTVRKSKEYEEQQTLMKFAREIRKIVEEEETMKQPEIKKFFYSGHTTVVIWDDGTKTISSPSGDEMFDPEMGLAMAVAKKYFGNRHKFEKVVADALYGKYLDDYKKMFVDKWTKNLKKKNTEEKLYAYNQILNALIDVKNNIRKHIDEELKKHEVDKKEFEKKLEEYEEAVKAGKKPKRPVLNSHRTPEMRDFQVRLKAIKDLITLIE